MKTYRLNLGQQLSGFVHPHPERTARRASRTAFGDEAADFRAEYDDLAADYVVSGTRASRFTWRELLDTMCGVYFD